MLPGRCNPCSPHPAQRRRRCGGGRRRRLIPPTHLCCAPSPCLTLPLPCRAWCEPPRGAWEARSCERRRPGRLPGAYVLQASHGNLVELPHSIVGPIRAANNHTLQRPAAGALQRRAGPSACRKYKQRCAISLHMVRGAEVAGACPASRTAWRLVLVPQGRRTCSAAITSHLESIARTIAG